MLLTILFIIILNHVLSAIHYVSLQYSAFSLYPLFLTLNIELRTLNLEQFFYSLSFFDFQEIVDAQRFLEDFYVFDLPGWNAPGKVEHFLFCSID